MMAPQVSKNTLYNLLFFGYLVFMGTTLKLTLGLSSISFIFTAAVIALPILVLGGSLRLVALSLQDTCIFLAAIFIITLSVINMLLYFRGFASLVQTMSFLFPWLVLTSVILNQEYIGQNQGKFWAWFNNFSVLFISLGLIEYVACIFFGVIPPYVETANGGFLVGWFTVFHALDPYTPHFRFYGPFGEPGQLAMWTSILIFYNLLRKNYLLFIILCIASFAAFSPSTLVSFLVATIVFTLVRKNLILWLLVLLLLSILFLFFGDDLVNFSQTIYLNKESSLASRYESTSSFFNELGFLVHNYPLGVPFFETSEKAFSSGISFAANFSPIWAFERGGIITFSLYLLLLGYGSLNSIVAIVSSKKTLIDCEIPLYFLILLPFVIQRASLFEFGIFPLLFASVFFQKIRRTS